MADAGQLGALDGRPAAPANAEAAGQAKRQTYPIRRWGLLIGSAALVAIIMLPQPAGLSVAGQHMLGIFAFAVIVWMTEAVEYAASSIMLMALIAFCSVWRPMPHIPIICWVRLRHYRRPWPASPIPRSD